MPSSNGTTIGLRLLWVYLKIANKSVRYVITKGFCPALRLRDNICKPC
jgi:hypothetical protein